MDSSAVPSADYDARIEGAGGEGIGIDDTSKVDCIQK